MIRFTLIFTICPLCDGIQSDERYDRLARDHQHDREIRDDYWSDDELPVIIEHRWWYQGRRFDSREDYLRANPWWTMTAQQLAFGRADPKCMLSFLSQDIVHSIALACFARD